MTAPSRISCALAFVAALALVGVGTAAAAIPPGPRIAYFEEEVVPRKHRSPERKEALGRFRHVDIDAGGHRPRTLPDPAGLAVGLELSWSADGREVAFVGAPLNGSEGEVLHIYVAHADGSGAHAVAPAPAVGPVVLSPDGTLVAFTRRRAHRRKIDPKNPKSVLEGLTHRYESTSTWIVPTAGGKARQLTPWGNGRDEEPSSFSPDGSTLAVSVARTGARPEVDAIELATGRQRTLELEASEAAYSPDGSKIAFVTYRDRESVPGFDSPEGTSEIYVAAADGTHARRITHTPAREESSPSWDPSGNRLAYLSAPGGLLGLLKGTVAESNADGTCPIVFPRPAPRHKGGSVLVTAPSWIPGAGRGAAPISC